MIGGTRGRAHRPEDVCYLIADVESGAVRLRHLTLGQKRTDIVVRWDIEKFRLRAPCLRWLVLTATDARAEFAAPCGAGTLSGTGGGMHANTQIPTCCPRGYDLSNLRIVVYSDCH